MIDAWGQALRSVKDPATLKIRPRGRRGYLPEARGYTTWHEYQVVEGRNVRWRAETQDQADRFIATARGEMEARY